MKLKNKWMIGVLAGVMGLGMGYSTARADDAGVVGTVSQPHRLDQDQAAKEVTSASTTPVSQAANEPAAGQTDAPSNISNAGQSSTGNGSAPSTVAATGDPMNQ